MAKKASPRRFWLFKSEPDSFSIQDLEASPNQTTCWDGVRNYQARNFLRDSIKLGDGVLFYHSNADPMAVVGTAEVVKEGYVDPTAFDPKDHHYDPKSNPDNPAWMMVDIKLVQVFPEPVIRETLKKCESLKDMELLRKGSRLSVTPVTEAEWKAIHELAGVSPDKKRSRTKS